jgi:hypothetical protein
MEPAVAASLHGQVLGAGAPIAESTVTLWAAGQAAPKELGRTHTDANGHFTFTHSGEHGGLIADPTA